LEFRLISRACRTRPRRAGPSRRARRVWTALGVVALAVAACVAAWHAPFGPLAPGTEPRRIVSAGLSGLARSLASPPRQRLIVFSSAAAMLLSLPLAAFLRRRRLQARQRAAVAVEQRARAPQIFEASLTTRPLRRATQLAAATQRADDRLPEVAPVPPEVAARAAELQAEVVREAAARALMLRAASERSETRRRAAALRARARRDRTAEAAAPEIAAPKLEAIAAPRAIAASQSERPTPPRSTPPRPPLPKPAAVAPIRSAPRPATQASPLPIAAPRRSEPSGSAPAVKQGIGRVAILRSSEPLTFEWLEQCLARDPDDIQARLDLCTALLVGERFADAERVAREGLERDANDGRLMLRHSEALSGLDRIDEALEIAVRAVRAHRSRKAILHLTRLSAVARRFSAGDGARLRKALTSRPNDPVFLHALGAFEVQRGSPREALPILRLALRQERNPRWRRVVSREIAQLRAEEIAAAGGRERRAAS
jgi:tetratricopeptide (TPR) repeat protein